MTSNSELHVYAHTHACAFIPVPSYMHTHMRVHLYLYPHTYIHIYMCIYTCTLMHIHTYTCTSIPAPSCIHHTIQRREQKVRMSLCSPVWLQTPSLLAWDYRCVSPHPAFTISHGTLCIPPVTTTLVVLQ